MTAETGRALYKKFGGRRHREQPDHALALASGGALRTLWARNSLGVCATSLRRGGGLPELQRQCHSDATGTTASPSPSQLILRFHSLLSWLNPFFNLVRSDEEDGELINNPTSLLGSPVIRPRDPVACRLWCFFSSFFSPALLLFLLLPLLSPYQRRTRLTWPSPQVVRLCLVRKFFLDFDIVPLSLLFGN